MNEFPSGVNLGIILLASILNTMKMTALSFALGAGAQVVPYLAAAAAPAIPAIAGIASGAVWHIIPGMAKQQNVPMGISEGIAAILNPIAGYSSFLAHKYLDSAAANKLTDITLDFTPYVMQYAVPIMLMPLIMLLVVVTGIRSISPAIGGEVQILGVTELI
jgi:hypothetical protein